MADSQKFVGAGSSSNADGYVDWTNKGNIVADDGAYARVYIKSGSPSYRLIGSTCGFAIPSGATINGIVLTVKRYSANANMARDGMVCLRHGNGTASTSDKESSAYWPTTAAAADYGSNTDLWGDTWTADEINGSGFGAQLYVLTSSATSMYAYVDSLKLTVYYTEMSLNGLAQASVESKNGLLIASTKTFNGLG